VGASAVQTDLRGSLRAARERIYASGKIEGEDGVARAVWPVGLTAERGEALRGLVVRERAMACVETGFGMGMSASFLLEGAMEVGGERARVVSMDPFQTSQWGGAGRRHLREAGAGDRHVLCGERSEMVLPRMVAEGGEGAKFDFAFIDGDHRFEHAFIDVFYARRLVGPGRVVVVDDAWMPSVRKCAGFFESAGLCAVEKGAGLEKFVVMRVMSAGDERAWDQFAEF